MRKPFAFPAIFALIVICCSGCFRGWVMTDAEIRQHYSSKPVKPRFYTIKNDSVSLFCAVTGADTLPPLLVIHGAPGAWYGNRRMLDDTLIQQRFQIISVDRLGYNRSTFKNSRKPVHSMRLQAIAIREALRLNRSGKTGVVVGSSYGAPIAAKMAILFPSDFHHLVMIAPAIDPNNEKFWWWHRFIGSGLAIKFFPEFIQHATEEKFNHERELAILHRQWSSLSVPVTVMHGGKDQIIAPENFEYAKKMLRNKNARFIYLPESTHMIRSNDPEAVRAAVFSTIDDVRPTDAISLQQSGS